MAGVFDLQDGTCHARRGRARRCPRLQRRRCGARCWSQAPTPATARLEQRRRDVLGETPRHDRTRHAGRLHPERDSDACETRRTQRRQSACSNPSAGDRGRPFVEAIWSDRMMRASSKPPPGRGLTWLRRGVFSGGREPALDAQVRHSPAHPHQQHVPLSEQRYPLRRHRERAARPRGWTPAERVRRLTAA